MSYSGMPPLTRRGKILGEVSNERDEQDLKWGKQNHPDLSPYFGDMRYLPAIAGYYGIPTVEQARNNCEAEHRRGEGSWFSIHIEELAEAMEAAVAGDTVSLRKELVQLAATVTAHIEHIDRRS